MKQRSTSANRGFSLIELIIVITIMAILTALLAPQLLRYVERSRIARDEQNIDEIYRAIMLSLNDEEAYAAVLKYCGRAPQRILAARPQFHGNQGARHGRAGHDGE